MTFYQPLDLEHWLVTVFAGTPTLFMFLAIAVIFTLGAKYRMPIAGIFGLLFMFVLIMAQPGLIVTGIARVILMLLTIILALALGAIYAREQK